MSLLPSRLHVSPAPADPKVLDIDDEEAAAAFDALGSETARAVLAAIYDEPMPPTAVRSVVGTSLQNVHYHLGRLEEAGLIEPAGTGYSAKGTEMTVYAPATRALVLFAGDDADGIRLRDLLGRLFGLFVAVCVSTLAFASVAEWLSTDANSQDALLTASDRYDVAEATTTAATSVDPVVAFFLGGLAVVVAVGAWWLLRPRLRLAAQSR